MMKTLSPKDSRVLGYWSVVTTLVLFTILLFVGGELHWMLLPFACHGMLGVAFIAESSDGEFATANRAFYRILGLGAGVPPIVIILSGWHTKGLDLQRSGDSLAVAAILASVSLLTFAFYVRRHGVDESSERREHAPIRTGNVVVAGTKRPTLNRAGSRRGETSRSARNQVTTVSCALKQGPPQWRPEVV